MNHPPYSVEIIRYTIPLQQREEFMLNYGKACKVLQESPYCLGYEIIQGSDEPEHYIVRIHWSSVEDHLNKFRKSKEFGSFFALVKPYFNAIEEMKHYELTDSHWERK